jgi:hypothetical protein
VKLNLDALLAPLVALLLLALIVQQTLGALRGSGAWRPRHAATAPKDDPYARLDKVLATRDTTRLALVRDPFSFEKAATPATPVHRAPPAPVPPPAPAIPVLTSIIWTDHPSATLRFEGHDYSVSAGTLFADFRVTNIARDQVVLDRAGAPIVLRLPRKGE